MSRGFSLYLDFVRFAAALIVVVSHVAYQRYSAGALEWARDLNIGSDAVILFFVLSGFVIAYTTFGKSRDAASYTKARAARLYSVLVPALIFTLAIDSLGASLNPARYDGWWYQPQPLLEYFARTLSFSTQLWSENIRPGTNGPYWSLSYEAWYYLAFGVAVFTSGRVRWLSLALIMAIVGPKVILLAPCWLAGVALEYGLRQGYFSALSRPGAMTLAVLPWFVYALCQMAHVPDRLVMLTAGMLGNDPNLVLGFSDEVLWNTMIAVLASLHFLGVYSLAHEGAWIGPRVEKALRWTAGATFSVYLFHYPLLTFFYSFPVYDPANGLHVALLTIVTLAACFALAELSERRLGAWKQIFDRLGDFLAKRSARHRGVA